MPTRVKHPRARLEKTLTDLLGSISARPVRDIRFRMPLLGGRCEARFEVVRVWVVGSFARGAALCGDLDVLVEVYGERLYDRAVAVELRGRRRHVQVHVGTPERNSSLVAFPDAVLLWTQDDHGFAPRIAAIDIDPEAGRHVRKYDALPVSPDRLYPDLDAADALADGIAEGSLLSDWVDLEDVPDTGGTALEAHVTRMRYRAGRKTSALLDPVGRWLVAQGADLERRHATSATDFWVDGIRCVIGCPRVPIGELSTLTCRALAVAPHLVREGPNGIWVLRRGPLHDLTRQFDALGLWLVRSPGGCRHLIHAMNEHGTHYRVGVGHPDRAAAGDLLRAEVEMCEPGESRPTLAWASGSALLDELSAVDVLETGDAEHALTLDGARCVGRDRALRPDEVRALLTGGPG